MAEFLLRADFLKFPTLNGVDSEFLEYLLFTSALKSVIFDHAASFIQLVVRGICHLAGDNRIALDQGN